jgi:diguanylate cyclase (GGDEF)-like protein
VVRNAPVPAERRRTSVGVARPPSWITWSRAAVIALVAIAGYAAQSGAAAEIWFQVVAWASIAAFVIGIVRHGAVRLAWVMVGVGFTSFVAGDLLFTLNEFVFHVDAFPSSADIPYLAGYPILAIGLASLVRRGTKDNGSLIDAGIVMTPLAVAGFVYIIQPTAATGVTFLEKLVSAAYPIGDLVCLAVLVRLIVGLTADGPQDSTGRRSHPALGLLVASLTGLLVGDLIFMSSTLSNSYVSGGWSDGLYLVSYVALGAAALDRSIADVGRPRPAGEVTLSSRRLGLLAIAALLTPIILAIQWLRDARLNVPLVVTGTVVSFLLVVARMSGLVQALESSRSQLRFDATHDALTGLPNRQLFATRFDETLRAGRAGALLFVDLDRFKAINDSLGHHEGDQVLIEVAEILRAGVRQTDVVARLSGDEFVVLIQSNNETEVLMVAQRLVSSVRVVRLTGSETIMVTASVGMAIWSASTPPDDAGRLMKAADDAMYAAKHLQGDQLVIAGR